MEGSHTPKQWTYERIEALVKEQVPEHLTLEYKGPGALDSRENITKAVSAMANAAGGVVIYGIATYGGKDDRKHLPEKIVPVDASKFGPEWLEQMIHTIRPRIDGLRIHSIPVEGKVNDVIYVVEAPQSTTAHQATDYKYYKRYNLLARPMEDREIRDVMARSKHPRLELNFSILKTRVRGARRDPMDSLFPHSRGREQLYDKYELVVNCFNPSPILANYVVFNVSIPAGVLHNSEIGLETMLATEQFAYTLRNTVSDVVGTTALYTPTYGPPRFVPILPLTDHEWRFRLTKKYVHFSQLQAEWSLHADSAPVQNGTVNFGEIEVVEHLDIEYDDRYLTDDDDE